MRTAELVHSLFPERAPVCDHEPLSEADHDHVCPLLLVARAPGIANDEGPLAAVSRQRLLLSKEFGAMVALGSKLTDRARERLRE